MAAPVADTSLHSRWQNRLVEPTEPRIPEPQALYALICLKLLLHRKGDGDAAGSCRQCKETWPCEEVLLAFRLREGF
jgi:hypothetical protein